MYIYINNTPHHPTLFAFPTLPIPHEKVNPPSPNFSLKTTLHNYLHITIPAPLLNFAFYDVSCMRGDDKGSTWEVEKVYSQGTS